MWKVGEVVVCFGEGLKLKGKKLGGSMVWFGLAVYAYSFNRVGNAQWHIDPLNTTKKSTHLNTGINTHSAPHSHPKNNTK